MKHITRIEEEYDKYQKQNKKRINEKVKKELLKNENFWLKKSSFFENEAVSETTDSLPNF